MKVREHAALLVLGFMAILVKKEESKKCAKKHCDLMTTFIEKEMNGFLDADLLQFYIDVKKEVDKF